MIRNKGKNLRLRELCGPECMSLIGWVKSTLRIQTNRFIVAAQENGADGFCVSALLTTMEVTVAAIKEKGLDLKTMLGQLQLLKCQQNWGRWV